MKNSSPNLFTAERLVIFSDAVFAIVITLLALDIHLPILPKTFTTADFYSQLTFIWPVLLSYFISFMVVGLFWVSHLRMFRYVTHCDERFVWMNVVLLLFISLLPFSSNLLGQYGAVRPIVTFYALHIVVIGLIQFLMWQYASRRYRLIDDDINQPLIRFIFIRTLIAPVVFVLSILIAFFSALVAMYFWILVVPLAFIARRFFKINGWRRSPR